MWIVVAWIVLALGLSVILSTVMGGGESTTNDGQEMG